MIDKFKMVFINKFNTAIIEYNFAFDWDEALSVFENISDDYIMERVSITKENVYIEPKKKVIE